MALGFAQKAVVVANERVLLIRKSIEDHHNPLKWEFPGGKIEDHEPLDDGLRREVHEEVGIEVVPGRPLALWSWNLGFGQGAARVIAVSRQCEALTTEVSLSHNLRTDHIDSFAWIPLDQVCTIDLMPTARAAILASIRRLAEAGSDHWQWSLLCSVGAGRTEKLDLCPNLVGSRVLDLFKDL